MALITLLTDYGYKDSYVASLKAKILSLDASVNIVDISHDIEKYHIPQAGYVFNRVFREFPSDTVHLIGVEHPYEACDYVLVLSEEGVFVAPDNGVLSLLRNFNPTEIVKLNIPKRSSFVMKDYLVEVAVKVSKGDGLSEFGKEVSSFKELIPKDLRMTDDEIVGSVIYVDGYGNLMTNIHKAALEMTGRGRDLEIKIGREYLTRINDDYKEGREARCIAIFNSCDYLEIAITDGNASTLLGLKYDSPVTVTFKQSLSLL